MLFKKFRSVPANTAITAPDWQKLTLAKGEIVEWIIFFDPEAADLLHVRIEYHGSQIMPFTGSEWITAFFTNTPMRESIRIDDPPYVLDIFAYNEDDRYPHEYFVHPIIMPDTPLKVVKSTFNFKDAWAKVFGGGG